jgi:uncharacterized protein (TIGR01777 family)
MKVVIPGGSGQVGQLLSRSLEARGHDVAILTRRRTVPSGRAVRWDGRSLGRWAEEVDGADVVINLAGRSVNCRYTEENLRQMLYSRVESTRAVGDAICAAKRPPAVWLQMSTATIYAHRYDAANDEHDGVIGGSERDAPDYWKISVEIAKNWEKEQLDADTPKTRKVAMRTAMVMSPDSDGIFDVLLGLVRLGLGGPVGGGKQYVSWIHDRDFLRAVDWLIANDKVKGPVNLASPGALPYREFMAHLRDAWGMPLGLPATKWMLAIGAWAMGSDSELVLKSRRVAPKRLLDKGFQFEFERWDLAANDLVERWCLDT